MITKLKPSHFRVDRFLTLFLFWPLTKHVPLSKKQTKISILMYHSVSNQNGFYSHPYFDIVTTPDIFENQMSYLHSNGYQVVSLTDALNSASLNAAASKKVIITFDDGYRDFYLNAYPVLQKYNFTATVFLPTSFVDSKNGFNGRQCLSWSEISELYESGIDFGSHTVSHPVLYDLKMDRIQYELAYSKSMIEEKLKTDVTLFSYPYAIPDHDRDFVSLVRQLILACGYKIGVSTRIGTMSTSESHLFLRRLPINSHDDQRLFRAKLEGGYNWLLPFQKTYKFLSRRSMNN